MTTLRFPSGQALDTASLPAVSSGRTTLADGSEGAQLQPGLAEPPRPRFPAISSHRLAVLAGELGTLAALEPDERWAANVERQAVAELARRAI